MTEETAANAEKSDETVDELSIIRQVKARLDKLPDRESRERVFSYVGAQLTAERSKRYAADQENKQVAMANILRVSGAEAAPGHYV